LDDILDLIINALAHLQAKSCSGYEPSELPDRLRVVASIDDLPYQHGRLLPPIQEGRSGETELADYESNLDSYSPERHINMVILNEADQDAHSQHFYNETPNKISDDDLTVNAPQDEDEATRTARRMSDPGQRDCS